MRKFLIAFLVSILALATVGLPLTVFFVTDTGGLGDKSFNDSAWAGVQMAVQKYGITANVIQSYEQADYVPNLTAAAQVADVVVAVGFMMQDAVAKVAPQFPNVKFITIDFSVDAPNVESFLFSENQGAYLAGYLAAAMSKTGKVGFVGGIPIPPVERYQYGYEAGIQTYNVLNGANVQVLSGYVGSFDDPAAGKAMTNSQFSEGADIVFAAAGLSGLGTIEAAKDAGPGHFAIGVDQDQDYLAPGYVLTSAMKRVDVAVFDGIKSVIDGTFKAGTVTLTLKDNGVGISPMTYTKQLVPASVMHQLDVLKQAVISGQIVVPATEKELQSFQVPPIQF
ncbi:BMP family lipoprotein [Athalassotoga saccharophila]|uniref:BMP family lipoprotein n=1 Tax=Athalassotoga saccharophila TaxID=1441386 RepID=UPI00137AADA5|nr:BMP family ABC transporter substrate-binding protein [Athalassotoga saccharophila]BBJ27343.1 ABC transporter, substrate-binding protein [Athalassotoga saccharophila]